MKCDGYVRRVAQASAPASPMSSAIPRPAPAGSLSLHFKWPATIAGEITDDASGVASRTFARNTLRPFRAGAGRSSGTVRR